MDVVDFTPREPSQGELPGRAPRESSQGELPGSEIIDIYDIYDFSEMDVLPQAAIPAKSLLEVKRQFWRNHRYRRYRRFHSQGALPGSPPWERCLVGTTPYQGGNHSHTRRSPSRSALFAERTGSVENVDEPARGSGMILHCFKSDRSLQIRPLSFL